MEQFTAESGWSMWMPSKSGQFNESATIAVLIPCFNEEVTIGKVVDDFIRELPEATVYVYDNNSTDATARIAECHGAVVRHESRQGKGNVVRQMLRDIDADCYVMVDGDDTYPASSVRLLVDPILHDEADHVVGDRLSNGSYGSQNKRTFHGFGNELVCWLIKVLYGFEYTDVMTGYRSFNRVFAKTFPPLTGGFEIETELSIHAVDKRWRIKQVPITYRDRPEGSVSKLNTVRDGTKVLLTIMTLFKDYKPQGFFSILAILALIVGLVIGIPIIGEYCATGLVPRLPSAIVAVAFCGLAVVLCITGLILDEIVKGNRRFWEFRVMDEYEKTRDK